MNKFYYLISFLLISLSSYAQHNNINLNGFNKFYYPNGQLSSEGVLLNGQPDGYWVSYYPTGVKKSEGNRKNSNSGRRNTKNWRYRNIEIDK